MQQADDEFRDKILIDGVPSDVISVRDRSLHYGDGLFETIAVVNGKACHWNRHLQRLFSGCKSLGFPSPDKAILTAEAEALTATVDSAVLKVLYTRGSGGRGYRPPKRSLPVRILMLSAWPDFPDSCSQEGIQMRVCQQRLGNNPFLAGLKHNNRLEQILARSEWDDATIFEGLMLDQRGYVIEGTMSNIFFVLNEKLCTPALDQCGVNGIVRDLVIEMGRKMSMKIVIDNFKLDEIYSADEVFVSNSLIGIWPVKKMTSNQRTVEFHSPGITTAKLQTLIQ